MRQEFDYERVLKSIDTLHVKLNRPASEGDVLKVYTAMALQQEVILDAMAALTSMVSNESRDENYHRFGETFQKTGNFINSQVQLLLQKATKDVAVDE